MRRSNQKGTILITLIIAIMMIGVLGAGIYSLTTTSTFTGLLSNKNDQAYHLAQAGVRYAIDKIIQANPNYLSTDFFLPDNNHKFNITIVNDVITSVGIVNADTFSETRRQIIYSVSSSWGSGVNGTGTCTGTCIDGICSGGTGTCPTILLPAPQEPVITLQNDSSGFAPTQSGAGAITVASDGSITLGGGGVHNSGTILYQGSSSVSNCTNGACNFPYGLRAYFEFTGPEDYGSTSYGDGFTFGVFNAQTASNPNGNTRDRSGGAPTGVNMGELGGYAGADNMSDQLGLIPPKIAVEFDTYANTGSITYNGCSGGRNDSANNHIALMFWGQNLASNCATGSTAAGFVQASFDDNIHGAGDGTTSNPFNSAASGNGSGLGGYYSPGTTSTCKSSTNNCNWMEDGYTYGFRMEIIRHTSGTSGLYQIKAWIYRLDLSGAPTGTQLTNFQDVQNPYTPYATSGPHINRIVTFAQAYNDALQKVYFGFTEATGDANQNMKLSNLKVFFPQTEDGTCIYNISPLSPNPASFGRIASSGTFSVEAVSGCSWSASTISTWIHTTSTGTGGASGSYTVDANATGALRTGTIAVTGGQSFLVTQSNKLSQTIGTITFTPATLVIGGTTTASATATSGLAVTFTSTTPAVCTVSGTNGSTVTGVTAGTCTIAANQAGNATYDAAPQVTNSITVRYPAPTVTLINPSSHSRDNVVFTVTISGTGFRSGATVTVSGTRITVGTVTVNSETQITTTFRIATNAATGSRTVTVTNTDGQSDTITFTVN